MLAATVGNISAERLAIIWPKISPCFTAADIDGRLVNVKLQTVQRERAKFLAGQSKKGIKGAAKRWQAQHIAADGRGHRPAVTKPRLASASASAFALSSEVKNTSDQPAKKTNPDVRAFIDWFRAEYQRVRQTEYLVNWKRDGSLAATMLHTTDLDGLKARTALLLTVDERFINGTDRGIQVLATKFSWLGDQLPKTGPSGIVGRDAKHGRTGHRPGKFAEALEA